MFVGSMEKWRMILYFQNVTAFQIKKKQKKQWISSPWSGLSNSKHSCTPLCTSVHNCCWSLLLIAKLIIGVSYMSWFSSRLYPSFYIMHDSKIFNSAQLNELLTSLITCLIPRVSNMLCLHVQQNCIIFIKTLHHALW